MKPDEAEAANVLNRIADGFIAFDARWRVTFVNRRAERMLPESGRDASGLLGKNFWEAFPGLVGSRAYAEYHRAAAEQTPVSFETFHEPSRTWFEVRAYPSADGLSVFFLDVGERRRAAEQEFGERTRIAMMISDIGLALTRGGGVKDMLGSCADALVERLGAAFARIWTLDEREGVLELQASSGMYTHTDGPHGRVPVGKFKIGLIAEERKPHLTNAVIGDPRVGDQDWAEREGMVAFAGYPLIVDDRLVGVMAMFAREQLTDATIQAMESVANGIALGVERKWAEREKERLRDEVIRMQAERLEEMSTPLIPLSDSIVLMPLIGTMDSARAERALNALANGVISRGARIAIIDITGVSTVDTNVAAALMKAASILRLLGAEAVITGVRPRVAQTLVALGVDLGSLVTRNNLQSSLDYARERLLQDRNGPPAQNRDGGALPGFGRTSRGPETG